MRNKTSKREWLLLLVVILVAAGLRLYHLGGQGLWLDEMYTLLEANARSDHFYTVGFNGPDMDIKALHDSLIQSPSVQPFAVVRDVYRTESDHAPLYFVIVHLFVSLFGTSEFVLRFPSALFGALTIPFLFFLGKRLHSSGCGFVAAGILALEPYQVYYGQEARPYSLLVFLGVASIGLLAELSLRWQAGDRSTVWSLWVAYIAVNAFGVYTHPFFVFSLGVQALMVAMWHFRDRTFLARWFLAMGLAFLIFLPWMVARLTRATPSHAGAIWLHGRWPVLQLLGSVMDGLLEFIRNEGVRPSKLKWLLIILPIFGLLSVRRRNTLWLLPLWVLIPSGAMVLIDVVLGTHASSVSRYYILAAPALYLLMALGLAAIRPRIVARLLTAVVLAYLAIGGYWTAEGKLLPRYEVKETGQWISQVSDEDGLVVLISSIPEEMAMTLSYYMERPGRVLKVRVRNVNEIDWAPFVEQLKPYRDVTIVAAVTDVGEPKDFDLQSASKAFPFLNFIGARSFRGAYVVRYRGKGLIHDTSNLPLNKTAGLLEESRLE